MGTRSTIALLEKEGSLKSVFVHWDGYISNNGVILYQHYKNIDKVRQLIELGSISSLKEDIIPPLGVEHTVAKPHSGVTSFYDRDGKEDNNNASCFSSLEDYFEHGELQEYNYVFKEKSNQWYVLNPNKILKKLEAVIMDDNRVESSFKNMINSVKLSEKLNKELEKNDKLEKKMKI